MQGWVWENTQAGVERIDTGMVWTLTVYANLRALLATVLKDGKLRACSLRIYGATAFHKTGKPHRRISVIP
ncbi:hypothetical protein D9M69_478390 [compost metagenome]